MAFDSEGNSALNRLHAEGRYHTFIEIDRLVQALDALWAHCALNRAEHSA